MPQAPLFVRLSVDLGDRIYLRSLAGDPQYRRLNCSYIDVGGLRQASLQLGLHLYERDLLDWSFS